MGETYKLNDNMKYIITENQNEKLIIKYLNNEYGDLKEYRTDEYPDSVFYVKDNKVYMEQALDMDWLHVDYFTIWKDLRTLFSLEDEDISRIITKWVEDTYGLSGVKIYVAKKVLRLIGRKL